MMTQPGTRVLISQDCREGGKATGQIGTYEGRFPLTVVFGFCPTSEGESEFLPKEYSYDDYKSGNLKLNNGAPAYEFYPEWELGKERPRPHFAMPLENPRIRLDDGTVIWGCECWWGEVADGIDLATAQARTEELKALLRDSLENHR